jgi:hypothetical protein
MDILRGFESPSPSFTGMDNKIKNETSKNDEIVTESPDFRVGDGYRSSVTLCDQLACLQDVDLRQGRIPCSSLNTHRILAHIPNNSSDSAGAMGGSSSQILVICPCDTCVLLLPARHR